MPSIIYFPLKTCRSPIVSYLLVLLIGLLWAVPLKALYYEPENPFIAPNEVPVILNISSGTIASVQQAIDTAGSPEFPIDDAISFPLLYFRDEFFSIEFSNAVSKQGMFFLIKSALEHNAALHDW